jgi:hypothetical protein
MFDIDHAADAGGSGSRCPHRAASGSSRQQSVDGALTLLDGAGVGLST